jgi:hypothetical protein
MGNVHPVKTDDLLHAYEAVAATADHSTVLHEEKVSQVHQNPIKYSVVGRCCRALPHGVVDNGWLGQWALG